MCPKFCDMFGFGVRRRLRSCSKGHHLGCGGDRYIVSARAGGVNYVEGTVAVIRKSGRSGLLLKGDTLEVGDRVSTGANGKAEILLNPGSFLRLGGLRRLSSTPPRLMILSYVSIAEVRSSRSTPLTNSRLESRPRPRCTLSSRAEFFESISRMIMLDSKGLEGAGDCRRGQRRQAGSNSHDVPNGCSRDRKVRSRSKGSAR
jgi:hypothetical protein